MRAIRISRMLYVSVPSGFDYTPIGTLAMAVTGSSKALSVLDRKAGKSCDHYGR